MAIPQDIIDNIQAQTDIVELIGSYIPMRRAGTNFKACCPFHNEKTASFVVSPEKQIYHCFGCGKGGNVYRFIMEQERVNFPEAVEMLGNRVGVTVPRTSSPGDSLKVKMLDLNKKAAAFYHAQLKSGKFSQVIEYLKARGLSDETIDIFGLGYAPRGPKVLAEYFRSEEEDVGVIMKARLASTGRDGSLLDMFRDRLMFPILDARKRVVGFGSRRLNDELDTAKYINTPETAAYHKGSNLFGIAQSKEHIVKENQCIVVEGNVDMIMPFQYGVKNIVATLGTALTVEQIRLIKRYTTNVVLMYDADNAGRKSALRVIDLLIEEQMNVLVATLSEGADPDTYVRTHGAEAFKKHVTEGIDFFDFKLRCLSQEHDLQSPQGKNKVAREFFETIKRFDSLVIRNEYLRKLSEALGLSEELVRQEFAKVVKGTKRPVFVSNSVEQQNQKMPYNERYILQAMLSEAQVMNGIANVLSPEELLDERARALFSLALEKADVEGNCDIADLLNSCPDDIKPLVSELTLEEFRLDNDTLREGISRIKVREKEKRFIYLKKSIEQAQKTGTDVADDLMCEFVALKKELDAVLKGVSSE